MARALSGEVVKSIDFVGSPEDLLYLIGQFTIFADEKTVLFLIPIPGGVARFFLRQVLTGTDHFLQNLNPLGAMPDGEGIQ